MKLELRVTAEKIFEGLRDIPRIPELDFVPADRYTVSGEEEVLHRIIADNDVIVVAGAFFGDEGKGKTIDAIARHPDIHMIMRPNSGENAGHTVFHNGVKYIFHLTPSGILVPGKINAIGPECVMDPVSFMGKEIAQLVANSVSYDDLYVGNVHIVTPYHKLMDFLMKPTNASTLKGMSPAHSSKVWKTGLRLYDLFGSTDNQVEFLKTDMESYLAMMAYRGWSDEAILERCMEMNEGGNKRIPDHVIDFLKAGDKIENLLQLYRETVVDNDQFPKRADTRKMARDTLAQGKKLGVESAQSYWLANSCEKFWRFATSASTTARGTLDSAGIGNDARVAVINVHKLPPSRVGIGANPVGLVPQDYFSEQGIDTLEKVAGKCEDVRAIEEAYFNAIGDNGVLSPAVYTDRDGTEYLVGEALAIAWSKEFDECGATTKKPRVLGIFDCVAHHEVNSVQGPYLTKSAVDRLDGCEKVGVVIAYVYYNAKGKENGPNADGYSNGDIIRPGDEIPYGDALRHCHPITKVLDGWDGNPIATDKRRPDEPLPKGAQDLIATVEHFTGAEMISIGNGPETKDLIYIKKI